MIFHRYVGLPGGYLETLSSTMKGWDPFAATAPAPADAADATRDDEEPAKGVLLMAPLVSVDWGLGKTVGKTIGK